MKRLSLALALAPLSFAAPAEARTVTVSSTAYCLGGTMANGKKTHVGAVAMPFGTLRLGKKVRVNRSPYRGRKRFKVEDRIAFGSQFDFWVKDCGAAVAWGRRKVRLTF